MFALAGAFAAAAAGIAATAGTAAATGVITGIVSNLATGDLLAGARVQIEGVAGETSSERGGSFSLPASAGSQTLVVSFSGLETVRRPVVVPAGGEVAVEIGLTSVYSDPRLIVDFKAQYRLSRRLEVYLDVLNLTNEFNVTFVREGGLKYNAQKQGTLYATGVKLTY